MIHKDDYMAHIICYLLVSDLFMVSKTEIMSHVDVFI